MLFRSALKVVGRVGYARASIAKISEGAKISIGTFYLHFKSKDELYDQLLPWCNETLSVFTQQQTQDATCYMDFEARNITAFFHYMQSEPSFLRVLFEAPVASPKAWVTYQSKRQALYMVLLNEAWDRGEFPNYQRADMDQLCAMLMDLRRSIIVRHFANGVKNAPAASATIQVYLKMIAGGLLANDLVSIEARWPSAHAILGRVDADAAPADEPAPVPAKRAAKRAAP